MRTFLVFSCLLLETLLAHNVDRHRCQYYENPQFVALYDNVIDPNPVGYCLANRNGDHHKEEEIIGYFPGQDVEVRPEDLMRNFNMGYLNVEEPLENLGDLATLNSDEIGMAQPPKLNTPTQAESLWKADEISTLVGPKLLPDVVLGTESAVEDTLPKPQILDEQEVKLGRTLVEDVPYLPDPMPVETSLKQEVADMGNVEFGEKYLETALPASTKSVVLENVVQREEVKEPDFMEQLAELKQQEIPEEKILEDLAKDMKDEESSEASSIPTTSGPVIENTIEKGVSTEEPEITTSAPVRTPTSQETKPKRKSRKSKSKSKSRDNVKTEKSEGQDMQTVARFSDSNDTLLDGLLTVL